MCLEEFVEGGSEGMEVIRALLHEHAGLLTLKLDIMMAHGV